ncbi:MAG TPA: hypothetical protein VKT27_00715 [Candidatus Binataceae bacterium]|nr:hypothetical protein [Candidatus Binataceae bacterium]
MAGRLAATVKVRSLAKVILKDINENQIYPINANVSRRKETKEGLWRFLLTERVLLSSKAHSARCRSIMNLKLEELRKRLLDPSAPNAELPPDTLYRRSVDAASSTTPSRAASANPPEKSDSRPSAPSQQSAETGESTKSARYMLTQAVSQVFDSTRQYQEQFADLARAVEVVEQTALSAARVFEPIRAFRDQMEKLSNTFEPMRSFEERLGTLAESFEPMRALHEQIAMLAEAFQTNLAQFARSMEPAKSFQAQLTRLAKAFEAVDELQNQFLALSEAFRIATRATNGTSAEDARS